MTAKAHVRTWQIAPNLDTYLDPDSVTTSKNFIRLFKDTLTGFALSPWVVESSCDSVAFGNNDQVDRWIDNDDIVPSVDEHSWTVLLQTGMGGQASLCLDFYDVSWTITEAVLVLSPNAGFGSANGGTDGTLLVRPTATDEIILLEPSGAWAALGWPSMVNAVMHMWQTTDGKSTRIVHIDDKITTMAMFFEVPKNPISAWTEPVVAFFDRASNVMQDGNLWDPTTDANRHVQFRHGARLGRFNFASTESSSQLNQLDPNRYAHNVTGETIMLPITLQSISVGLGGIWGAMEDLYFGSDTQRSGQLMEDDAGEVQWVLVDDLWMPWSNEAGVMRIM